MRTRNILLCRLFNQINIEIIILDLLIWIERREKRRVLYSGPGLKGETRQAGGRFHRGPVHLYLAHWGFSAEDL